MCGGLAGRNVLRYETRRGEPFPNHVGDIDMTAQGFQDQIVMERGRETHRDGRPVKLLRAAHEATSFSKYAMSAIDIGF